MTTTTKNRPMVGQIYTTGTFCEPSKWTNPDTGKTQWCWVITEFNDGVYMNGQSVGVAECANSREQLMLEITD